MSTIYIQREGKKTVNNYTIGLMDSFFIKNLSLKFIKPDYEYIYWTLKQVIGTYKEANKEFKKFELTENEPYFQKFKKNIREMFYGIDVRDLEAEEILQGKGKYKE